MMMIEINIPPQNIKDIQTKNEYMLKAPLMYSAPIVNISSVPYNSHYIYLWNGAIWNTDKLPKYDSVCIIETQQSGGNGAVYICFLLQSGGFSETAFDKLWNKSDSKYVQFDLTGEALSSKNVLMYKDGINTVLIYLTPFPIKNRFKGGFNDAKWTQFSTKIAPDYKIVSVILAPQMTPKSGALTEGFSPLDISGNGWYLDCEPTSESTQKIDAITLPLDEQGNINLSNSLFASTVVNALVIVTIATTVVLVIPSLFKTGIMELINKAQVPDRQVRLRTVQYFIVFIMLVLVLALLADGAKSKNTYEVYASLVIGFMLVFSILRMWLLRNSPDFNFPQIYNWSGTDFWVWGQEAITYVRENFFGVGSYYIGMFVAFILPFVIALVVAPKAVLPAGDTVSHGLAVILGFGMSYLFIIAPYAHLFVATMSTVKK